jgi:branched-chain amino acid transport system substrate-binding protein
MRLAAGACLLAALAVGLGGCGSGRRHLPPQPRPSYVDIYSSLPTHGPDASRAQQMRNGIALALAQAGGRAGAFHVRYIALDDSTAAADGASLARVLANAHRAAADPRAVYFIGELGTDALETSLPVLNEADIAQVSPGSTYVGLTSALPGAAKGQPQAFEPSGQPTFVRLVPNDDVEAAADLEAMRAAGCARVELAYEQTLYGGGQAQTLQELAPSYHVALGASPAPPPSEATAYAQALRPASVRCFEYAGDDVESAVALADAVHEAHRRVRLFVPHPLCAPAFTDPQQGGITAGAGAALRCTMVTAPLAAYLGGLAFAAAYGQRFPGSTPSAWALLGYEAMRLGLHAIAAAGSRGNQREAVRAALFAVRNRRSPLGPFSVEPDGDTTLRSFGLYAVGAAGQPVFRSIVTPPKVLGGGS